MNHEAPHYDEHPERSQNEWQTLMANGVVDTNFKPTQEYLTSEQGQREVEVQNKAHDQIEMVDRLIANAQEQAENGRYSNVEFERLKKKYEAKKEVYQKEADERSEAAKQDFSDTFADRNSIGTPEEEWVDDPQRIYSREEAIAAHEKKIADAKEQEKLTAPEHEKEIVSAEEKEKLAQLEHKKAIANLAEAAEQNEFEKEQLATAITNLAEAAQEKNGPVADTIAEKINQEAEADRAEQLEILGGTLDRLRFDLAELFVKKNRIIGPKHREEYEEVKELYEKTLNRYLRLKSQIDHESNHDQQSTNARFLENYIEEDRKLLEAVNNQVDNGNLFRKIISKTLGNKYYKQALLAHGLASLGVSGASEATPPFRPETTTVAPKSAPYQVEPIQSEKSITPENSADISASHAAHSFENLNNGRVSYSPNYYGNNNGAIITDINPADLKYPDGWYYAKGALRNKHNTTNGIYEEISMIRPDGTPWPSTFTAGNTPLSSPQSSSENPDTASESRDSDSKLTTGPEPVATPEAEVTTQEFAPLNNLSEEDQRLNEIMSSANLDFLRNHFHNILDENGIEILGMDPAPVGSERQSQTNDRIQDWWEDLDKDQKNAVLQYENENQKSDFGGALRNWLQSQGLLGPTNINPEVSTVNSA